MIKEFEEMITEICSEKFPNARSVLFSIEPMQINLMVNMEDKTEQWEVKTTDKFSMFIDYKPE